MSNEISLKNDVVSDTVDATCDLNKVPYLL